MPNFSAPFVRDERFFFGAPFFGGLLGGLAGGLVGGAFYPRPRPFPFYYPPYFYPPYGYGYYGRPFYY